jgi:hypothetical protein
MKSAKLAVNGRVEYIATLMREWVKSMSVREKEKTALCKGCGWSFSLWTLYAGTKLGEWLCADCLYTIEREEVSK